MNKTFFPKLGVTFLLLVAAHKFQVVQSTLPNPRRLYDISAYPKVPQEEQSKNNFGGSFDWERRALPPLPAENAEAFPKLLDLRMLESMPVVVLHPSKPIRVQLSPNGGVKNQQSVVNNDILKIIGSATQNPTTLSKFASGRPGGQKTPVPGEDQGSRQKSKSNMTVLKEEPRRNEEIVQGSDAAAVRVSGSTVAEHRARGPRNLGWLRGSFSNTFPQTGLFQTRPMHFGLKSPGPVFFDGTPKIPYNLPNPYAASNNNPVFLPFPGPLGHFGVPQHHLSSFHPSRHIMSGDFSQAASHRFPLIQPLPPSGVFGSGIPFRGRRPFPPFLDQVTSASGNFPHHVLPPPGFVVPPRPVFHAAGKRKNTPVATASSEISSAFADFAASEQEPEVVQGFVSVGGSINKFLNMMGLGLSGIAKGFGDFTDPSGREIDGRSLDFFPGYGNQAMLDDMDDMDIFQEDVTEEYWRSQPNVTRANGTRTPQKPSTKPPMQVMSVNTEKTKVAAMTMSSTKPTRLPNPILKSSPEAAEDLKKPVGSKINGSAVFKMSHLEGAKPGGAGMSELQGKDPHTDHSMSLQGGARSVPNAKDAQVHTSINNHSESNKMMPLPAPTSPQQQQQRVPQHDAKRPITIGQNQKQVHMGHANAQFGGGSSNVQNHGNLRYYNYNSSAQSFKTYQKMSDVKGPVQNGDSQKYSNARDITQHGDNETTSAVKYSGPHLHYYQADDLKESDKMAKGNYKPSSHSFNPQTPQNEKRKPQANIYKDANYEGLGKKPVPTKVSNETSYATAHSMSGHESSDLLNTDDVRPWIPVSTGQGFVERRPVAKHVITSPLKEQVKEIVQKPFYETKENSETLAKKRN